MTGDGPGRGGRPGDGGPGAGLVLCGAELSRARAAAVTARAAWLAAVRDGRVNVEDVLAAASRQAGAPLLRIGLVMLLAAQPGWGVTRARRAVRRLVVLVAGRPTPAGAGSGQAVARLDLAWLLDGRARGRTVALLTVLGRPSPSPWPGFPWTAQPGVPGRGGR